MSDASNEDESTDPRIEAARRAANRISDENDPSATLSFEEQVPSTLPPRPTSDRPTKAAAGDLSGRFGRYQIFRALGKGAMGAVYLAEDTELKRLVAIKTPHFEDGPTGEQLERFYREARAAATLRHANICPVYDVGQIDGRHYISMAYIEGTPLSAFVRADRPQTDGQVLILIRKLALALADAHQHGVVHRDLKPANIMVDNKSEPVITDFGLARQVRPDDEIRLTQSGVLLGTPAYMSPEQVEGEPEQIGPATDQYSLGVILYELLTGTLPFRGNVIAVIGQILSKQPTPPSQLRADLDPRIEAVCLKMMAKNPADRFASLTAAAEELAALIEHPEANPPSGAPAKEAGSQVAGDLRLGTGAGASPIATSQLQEPLTESQRGSLEEVTRKYLQRRDQEASLRRKAETALKRLRRGIRVELAMALLVALWLGTFLAAHFSEPRFLVPAAALHVGVIAFVIATVQQLQAVSRVDFESAGVVIQQRLEKLCVWRVRTTVWTLLLAALLWMPLLIVSLKSLFDVDFSASLGRAWIFANLLFGVFVIAAAIWLSRRVERFAWVQRFRRDLAGRNLGTALESVCALVGFEEEVHRTG